MSGSRDPEPIEAYLDELLVELRLPPRPTRRLITETEAHLRESAQRLERDGMSAVDAEEEAVRRFGSARDVAAAAVASRQIRPQELVAGLAWSALTLASAGLAAVGLSGLFAALANLVAGPHFVGALPQTYTDAVCRGFLAAQPSAVTCSRAATLEVSQDAVILRCAAGVVGVALLAVALWWRRRLRLSGVSLRLLDGAVAAVAATAFAAASAVLVGLSLNIGFRHGGGGVGFYLSGGVAALMGAAVCAAVGYRRLRLVRVW